MSRVAVVGVARPGSLGPKNTPAFLIDPACRARLSMKDGIARPRKAAPVAIKMSYMRIEAVTSQAVRPPRATAQRGDADDPADLVQPDRLRRRAGEVQIDLFQRLAHIRRGQREHGVGTGEGLVHDCCLAMRSLDDIHAAADRLW